MLKFKPQIRLIKVLKCMASMTALGFRHVSLSLADISTSQLVFYSARFGVRAVL